MTFLFEQNDYFIQSVIYLARIVKQATHIRISLIKWPFKKSNKQL